ncbi:MAG: hypothetical protein M3A44_13285 [Gammaproteobacteria bacterium]
MAIVVAAVYTGGAAASAFLGSSAAAGLAVATGSATVMTTTAGAIAGATGGFTAGLLSSGGELKPAVRGGVGGGLTGGVGGYFGDTWNLQRVAANSVAGGVSSELQGGQFRDGFKFAVMTSSASYAYNEAVKYDVTWQKGEGAVNKRTFDMPVKGAINIGTAGTVDPSSWWGEGGIVSRFANHIPGVNAVSGLHDVFQIRLDEWGGNFARNVFNVPGMIPAAAITSAALLDDVPGGVLTVTQSKREW